jgi:hypothetical protein
VKLQDFYEKERRAMMPEIEGAFAALVKMDSGADALPRLAALLEDPELQMVADQVHNLVGPLIQKYMILLK